jgi:hypothetical protein
MKAHFDIDIIAADFRLPLAFEITPLFHDIITLSPLLLMAITIFTDAAELRLFRHIFAAILLHCHGFAFHAAFLPRH